MQKYRYWDIGLVLMVVLLGCNSTPAPSKSVASCKQEQTKATDWVSSWRTCSGDGAIKADGTLWQLGKVGGCDWGQIVPIDPDTGKSIYKKKYIYHLKPKKMGDGFDGAKIMNGGYRVYAIKKDGSLWGWGENFAEKPMLLSASNDWVDFKNKWSGNGCCEYNVGLKKDGSIWTLNQTKLKRVGTQKGWDKVVLHCCTMYATKKDGVLWLKTGMEKFKKSKGNDCGTAGTNCQEVKDTFRRMPSQSIYNLEAGAEQDVKQSTKAGTLCVMPEEIYES